MPLACWGWPLRACVHSPSNTPGDRDIHQGWEIIAVSSAQHFATNSGYCVRDDGLANPTLRPRRIVARTCRAASPETAATEESSAAPLVLNTPQTTTPAPKKMWPSDRLKYSSGWLFLSDGFFYVAGLLALLVCRGIDFSSYGRRRKRKNASALRRARTVTEPAPPSPLQQKWIVVATVRLTVLFLNLKHIANTIVG